jgi:type I restriction enzyme S subunit
MSVGLPWGWTRTTLEQVVENISYGFTASAASAPVGPQFLRITDLQHGSVQWESVPYCKIPASKVAQYSLRSGDIVFARTGATTGKSFLITSCPPAVFASYLIRVRVSADILPEFVAYFFQSQSYWNQVNENISGSAQPSCNASKLETLKLPIAPLNEQRRIVAKLEKLLDKVDSCQQRLAKISILLKRFRQAVLAAACSGQLTADWREENSDLETGASLIGRIRAIRLGSAQTNKERNQIQQAFQYEDAGHVLEEVGFDYIPDSWITCRIGAIGAVVNGSTPSRKTPKLWDGEIPWVSSGEVRNNFITGSRERITKAGFNGCSVRLLPAGTVLLAMIGEGKTRGQTAVLKIPATINQNIAAILLDHGLVIPEFLWIWFQRRYESTREAGSGSGPQALNCQRVRELPFVLPPLEEQQAIVRRADELLSLETQVEGRYAKAKHYVDSLKQSILAKAFRGELAPQDQNDEPATVLLKRIREADHQTAKV